MIHLFITHNFSLIVATPSCLRCGMMKTWRSFSASDDKSFSELECLFLQIIFSAIAEGDHSDRSALLLDTGGDWALSCKLEFNFWILLYFKGKIPVLAYVLSQFYHTCYLLQFEARENCKHDLDFHLSAFNWKYIESFNSQQDWKKNPVWSLFC